MKKIFTFVQMVLLAIGLVFASGGEKKSVPNAKEKTLVE